MRDTRGRFGPEELRRYAVTERLRDGRPLRLRAVRPGDKQALRAEVAFAVDDAHQRLGVATLLLKHLVRIGRRMGIETFEAMVLPGNRPMLDVFEHSGLPQRRRRRDGVLQVELSLGRSF